MVQLLEIHYAIQEGCIFLGNMYNECYMIFCEAELISFQHAMGMYFILIITSKK